MSLDFEESSGLNNDPDLKKDDSTDEDLLLLSMQMVLDEIEDVVPFYKAEGITDEPFIRMILAYHDGMTMSSHCLYWLPEDVPDHFPADTYPFVSSKMRKGRAPHIIVHGFDGIGLLNFLISVFQKYLDFEASLNSLLFRGGDLDELCRLGASFFHNPMYIHDQYFSILARPFNLTGQLELEYNERTGRYNIPLSLIEDFKFSEKYRKTLGRRSAGIWGVDQIPVGMRTMYVNLFDGDDYRGRLLINELQTPFTPGQFKLAEYLGTRIVYVLRRRDNTGGHYRSHEDTMKLYLTEQKADSSDLSVLLFSLEWATGDTYLCLMMKSQLPEDAIGSENILRGRISVLFRSISFYCKDGLCFVINLSAEKLSSQEVSHIIAPIMRDSLMYCGMSNPITGFDQLPSAYVQASATLSLISRWKDSRWIAPFESCALIYLRECIASDLPLKYLCSCRLQTLRAHDRKHGTEYCRTLRAYLENERNIPRTSTKLIIHRTTLLYRLEKIREIITLHLDDPDERMYLLISFKIMDQADQFLPEEKKNL